MKGSLSSPVRTQETIEYLMEGILGLLRILLRQRGSKDGKLIDETKLVELLAVECPEVTTDIRGFLIGAWCRIRNHKSLAAAGGDPYAVTFLEMCAETEGAGIYPPEDLQYFAMRSIRRRYGLYLSSAVAAAAHHLVQAVARRLEQSPNGEMDFEELGQAVRSRVRSDHPPNRRMEAGLRKAFIDVAVLLGLFEFSPNARMITLRPEGINPEFMMVHLFGVTTAIQGFDALFGGGGLMLADSIQSKYEAAQEPGREGIGGRAILCIGRFASGKTLLSLQMAVEVARKGGAGWIMTLEQSVAECLYALESVGISTHQPSFVVVEGLGDALFALSQPKPNRGVLVFVRPEESEKHDYGKFLDRIASQLKLMANYPLRLLIVDPLNALEQAEGVNYRKQTLALFTKAKDAGVNVWFTSEQMQQGQQEVHFAENIADTVIHLGVQDTQGQQKRYVEITKSRFQQESQGRHGVGIGPNGGVQIYPSTALIAAKSATTARHMATRPFPEGLKNMRFGVPGIERLLGPEPICPGDVIAFSGPGEAKTLLGMKFLLAHDQDRVEGRACLLISDFTPFQVQRLIAATGGTGRAELIIKQCTLSTGYIDPGRILGEIRNAFEKCRREGLYLTRVLLTNLSRWEEEMPLIVEDHAFGIALITLIRSYRIAAVIVYGDSDSSNSRLRATVFDQADTLVHFQRAELHGRVTSLVTAIKTRSMRHQREIFEIEFGPEWVQVRPMPLLRIKSSGDVDPVNICLALHSETKAQREHNAQLMEEIKATISKDTRIGDQTLYFNPGLLAMSQYSSADELRVLQLDEFQLPNTPSADFPVAALYSFDREMNSDVLVGRLPELTEKQVYCDHGRRFLAVPFYVNFSLLMVDQPWYERIQRQLDFKTFPESWSDLAEQCMQLDIRGKAESNELLFSCPVDRNGIETYSCLFFEILNEYRPLAKNGAIDVIEWLSCKEAVNAAYDFWRICYRSIKRNNPPAAITRYWFSIVNQRMAEMSPLERSKMQVRPLFGDMTTAGEWYLSVPAQSASPEIGLRLIEQMTAPRHEAGRADAGIGLPTRAAFYEQREKSTSRYFHFPRGLAHELLRKAIRRSRFQHYQRFSASISSHLQGLLEMPGPTTKARSSVMPEIGRVIGEMVSMQHFLGEEPESQLPPSYRDNFLLASHV